LTLKYNILFEAFVLEAVIYIVDIYIFVIK